MRRKLGALVVSTLLFGAGVTPAFAVSTTLPNGANPGDTSAIQAFVCPTKGQMWLPTPLADDPISSKDFKYDRFTWRLFDSEDNQLSGRDDEPGSSLIALTWEPYSTLTPGEEYTVTVRGEGDSDDPVEFDFDLTVMSEEFSGAGEGTPSSPYLITSASELNEMRCIQGAYWKLTSNIDLSNFNDGEWTPLTLTNSYDWSGTIDGNDKAISNGTLGQPNQPYVGLLGSVVRTSIADLTLDSFSVTGSDKLGALASQAEYGITLDNITASDAQIEGSLRDIGLMLGTCNNGCAIKDARLSGNINVLQGAYLDGANVRQTHAMSIGGVAGKWAGSNGGFLSGSEIDVQISVRPEADYQAIASNLSTTFDTSWGDTSKIGGIFGETDEDFVTVGNKVTVDINVEAFARIMQVGGIVGQNDFPSTQVDLDSTISIVTLGADQQISEIGGAVGQSDDIAISRSRIHSNISVADGDGWNNYFGIDAPSGSYDLDEVGGVYGEYDDDTADFLNEVQTQIDIVGADNAVEIGGYLGYFDDDNGLNMVEIVTSGEINVEANLAQHVGGFAGTIYSSGALFGSSVVSAVEVNVDAGTAEDIGPVAGSISSLGSVLPLNFYWDTQVNDYENQSGFNFLPAETTQLTDQAFLSEIGFDMAGSWTLEGSYPVLNQGILSDDPNSGIGEPIQIGDTLVFVKGNRDFTTAGGLLELEGEGLRGVALAVNGQPLFVQIVTDTSGFVQIPAGLAPGSYTLVATANSGNQSLQDAFRILGDGSNSAMKVWTKRIAGETQAKFYAKNIVGEGKVRFVLNGREIAWINAVDNSDPKLRSANGAYYLVRTADLKIGKNVLEIYVDGTREKRVVYTR